MGEPLATRGSSHKTPLTNVRGSVDSARYRAVTVPLASARERLLPRAVRREKLSGLIISTWSGRANSVLLAATACSVVAQARLLRAARGRWGHFFTPSAAVNAINLRLPQIFPDRASLYVCRSCPVVTR